MGLVRFALDGNYKRFYNELKVVGKEINKSPIILFIDTAFSTVICGSGLSDYLNYRFYNKNLKQRREYATIAYQAKFYKKAAHDQDGKYFYNKLNFHEKFKDYTKRDYFNPADGLEEMDKFLKAHPTFIIKPVAGLGGTDVKKMTAKEIKDHEKFLAKLKKDDMFLEEYIVQNKEWGKISPNSVNTIRVMTSAMNGKSKVFFAAARIGNGKSVADNFHQGGMGVLVDYEKGILVGRGIDKDLNEYITHPTTGVKFDGFKIPYWKEINEMCKKAALLNDKVHVVGWDVAITDDGPTLIEGNNGPGFDLVQVLVQHGTKYMLEDIKAELKKEGLW